MHKIKFGQRDWNVFFLIQNLWEIDNLMSFPIHKYQSPKKNVFA